jgi:hypothetical protein
MLIIRLNFIYELYFDAEKSIIYDCVNCFFFSFDIELMTE